MKKILVLFSLITLIVFSFVGCDKLKTPQDSFEERQTAYMNFLSDLNSGKENPQNLYKDGERELEEHELNEIEHFYCLKDLDGDGLQELIVKNNFVNVTVYTFNDGLKKVGNENFGTGTTRLLYSDNPSYFGVFTFWVGGGLNHYGYLTVVGDDLIHEEIWNYDYAGITKDFGLNRKKVEELSSDKQLIAESKRIYKENRDLEFQEV